MLEAILQRGAGLVKKHKGKLFAAGAVAWGAAVLYFSVAPANSLPLTNQPPAQSPAQPPVQKFYIPYNKFTAHVAEHAPLSGFVYLSALKSNLPEKVKRYAPLLSLGISSAYGIVSEAAQYFSSGRHASIDDAAINVWGASLGTAAVFSLQLMPYLVQTIKKRLVKKARVS